MRFRTVLNVLEKFLPGRLLLCSVENTTFHEQIVVSFAVNVIIFSLDIPYPSYGAAA